MPWKSRRERRAWVTLLLFILATPLGAVLGVANLGPHVYEIGPAKTAAIFGGVVGLVTSPAPAFLLSGRRALLAVLSVYGATACLSFVLGFIMPLWTAPVVLCFFITACVVAFIVCHDYDRDDEDTCKACGYDLRGLPARTCPECGFDNIAPLRRHALDSTNSARDLPLTSSPTRE